MNHVIPLSSAGFAAGRPATYWTVALWPSLASVGKATESVNEPSEFRMVVSGSIRRTSRHQSSMTPWCHKIAIALQQHHVSNVSM